MTEGNLISGGTSQSTLLTTIVSLDPIHCYFDADEQAFPRYTRLAMEGKRQSSRDVKNPVYIALADETHGYPHKGHMDFVDNRLDPNTGTMRGRAIFRNPDLSLTPGLFARLRLAGKRTLRGGARSPIRRSAAINRSSTSWWSMRTTRFAASR